MFLQATENEVDLSPFTDAFLGVAIVLIAGLFGLALVVATIAFVLHAVRHRRLQRSGIAEIDAMDGRTFERYLDVLFQGLGYTVERTRFIGDYGGDLVLRKHKMRTVVQAKRYTKSVGVKAVQEAVAAKGYYECDHAMVVTNSAFTRQALELARRNHVIMRDRDWLIGELERLNVKAAVQADQQARRPRPADAARPAAPPPANLADAVACRACSKILTAGERRYCEANSRRFAGQMLCFRHQHSARRD